MGNTVAFFKPVLPQGCMTGQVAAQIRRSGDLSEIVDAEGIVVHQSAQGRQDDGLTIAPIHGMGRSVTHAVSS